MLNYWRSRLDDKSPTKSPTKSSERASKAAISVNTEASSLSLSGSHQPSISTKQDQSKLSYNLVPPENLSRLACKDFVILFVEISMTFSRQLIRKRTSDAHVYQSRLTKSRRELEMDLLCMQGWGTFGSILTGVLADGFVGNFLVAICSMLIILFMMSCLYFEQILIIRLKMNPYSEIVTEVAAIVHLLNHSTGFSRVVFGLENMKNKGPSAISLLIFVFTVTGDFVSSGGLLMMIAQAAKLSTVALVQMGWWSNLLSLVLFLTVFKSIYQDRGDRALSQKVFKCILGGLWHICFDRCVKLDWKDSVQRKYDKFTLTRVKALINYLVLLIPIWGYVFCISGKFENLYSRVPQVADISGAGYVSPLLWLALIICFVMAAMYFIIIPGLMSCGMPKKFNYQFSIGYFLTVCAMYYLALVLKMTEKYEYDSGIGYVRIYNARDQNVTLVQLTESLSHSLLNIAPHSAVIGSYVISEEDQLMLMMIKFDEETNFTVFIKAEPKKCRGYAILDPPAIISLSENIPLFQKPALADDDDKSVVYLFNAASTYDNMTIRFRDVVTGEWILQLNSTKGSTIIFQLSPGSYEMWVEGTDLHKYIQFNSGGLYGIMLLADSSSGLLELDVIIPGKELSPVVLIGFAILYGMSLTSYVTLGTLTYTRAPNGLLYTCFGLLYATVNLAAWALLVGFYTWHPQILGNVVLTYCIAMTVLFMMSVFIMLKYNEFYT